MLSRVSYQQDCTFHASAKAQSHRESRHRRPQPSAICSLCGRVTSLEAALRQGGPSAWRHASREPLHLKHCFCVMRGCLWRCKMAFASFGLNAINVVLDVGYMWMIFLYQRVDNRCFCMGWWQGFDFLSSTGSYLKPGGHSNVSPPHGVTECEEH